AGSAVVRRAVRDEPRPRARGAAEGARAGARLRWLGDLRRPGWSPPLAGRGERHGRLRPASRAASRARSAQHPRCPERARLQPRGRRPVRRAGRDPLRARRAQPARAAAPQPLRPPRGVRGRPPQGSRGARARDRRSEGHRQHLRGVRLGSRPVEARVRRAQGELLARVAMDVVVAGAGMAGLVAAARARELGASVTVYEKGSRAGGSMLLSSGFAWRHRDFETFRAECPGGDPELQRVLFEQLDDALDWLEALGVPVLERDTGNPLTSGLRFDTRALVRALAADVRLGEPLVELPDGVPVVLATGGFQGDGELV